MVDKSTLETLAEADGMHLSLEADNYIKAINKNGGYCIKCKITKEQLKTHSEDQYLCPCYAYRKNKECSVGLFSKISKK